MTLTSTRLLALCCLLVACDGQSLVDAGRPPDDAGSPPPDAFLDDASSPRDAEPRDAGSDDGGLDDGGLDAGGPPTCEGPGISGGEPGGSDLDRLPEGATRYFYAGEDEESSVRCNAVDDPQTLYYDVYDPEEPNGSTVLYLHGGGYNVGNANFLSIAAACEQLTALGSHCISIEYRRGFLTTSVGVSMVDPTPEDAGRFRAIIEMAKQDVLDAWDHIDAHAEELGIASRYIVIGESAGGSLASRVTVTNPDLAYDVVGAIIGFGTHENTEPLAADIDYPVVIQGGLMDGIQPSFTNPIWFDADMPIARGLFDLAALLRTAGVPTRMYVSAQLGHGFGAYEAEAADGEPLGEILHYPEAMAYFRAHLRGEGGADFTEWFFTSDDCAAGITAGERIRTDGFRYDPRQADLESGMTPREVVDERGRPRACPDPT